MLSASPVSGVSSLRCRPHGCPPLGAAAGPLAANCGAMLAADEPLEPEPLAAFAIPYVPAAMPNASAARTTIRSGDQRFTLLSICVTSFRSVDEAHLRRRN